MRALRILPLFIVTCSFKVGLAVLAWYVQSIFVLGSIIPLLLMLLYIFVGYRYRELVVSDEKFADSCYYLGFIFTIVSIILCLVDLPNIEGDITIIAARFGAAMISTVLGLFVRVCLVSFRPTIEDAVRNMEDHSVEASRRLIDSYQRSFNDLEHFRGEVAAAAKSTVLSVTQEIQGLTEQTAKRMDEFFVEVSTQNSRAMAEILADVHATTVDLKKAVEAFTKATTNSVGKVDKTVDAFSVRVVEKLDAIDFPQDLFSRKLDTAIQALSGSTDTLTQGVTNISGEVLNAARLVEKSITKINLKTDSMNTTLVVAEQISAQQGKLLEIIETRNEGMIKNLQAQQEQIINALDQQRRETVEGVSKQIVALTDISGTFQDVGKAIIAVKESVVLSAELASEIKSSIERSADEDARDNVVVRETLTNLEQAIKSNRDDTRDISLGIKNQIDSQLAHQEKLNEVLGELDKTTSANTQILLATKAAITSVQAIASLDMTEPQEVEASREEQAVEPVSKETDSPKTSWFGRKENS